MGLVASLFIVIVIVIVVIVIVIVVIVIVIVVIVIVIVIVCFDSVFVCVSLVASWFVCLQQQQLEQ